MSYQVLARKWRPRVFKEMVGQEHVLKALINALDNDRLHHAYLFTGTRGVGKTTIARILAKCLNCEQGVTSEPCDQCTSCVEINEGRFVDLIEVDAASRTKVEDTRELLDNVQYSPTKGRYKVYLIDEVHMLSGHSFNALLKTLEEPPPHVKFLLATTDPQKLPVTILSRCLQFNLKNMPPERIVEHLQHVLGAENIPFENPALWHLGRSADGSMRDALSLTDQAISFGEGKVSEADVGAMLGSIDRGYIFSILQALCQNDGNAMLAHVARMAEHSPDYEQALAEMIALLHRIAIAQVLPDSIDNTFGDREQVLALAAELSGEDVQLFYQTALLGRRDLPLAPDPRGGFEMTMLRLLAFKPETMPGVMQKPPAAQTQNDSLNETSVESSQQVVDNVSKQSSANSVDHKEDSAEIPFDDGVPAEKKSEPVNEAPQQASDTESLTNLQEAKLGQESGLDLNVEPEPEQQAKTENSNKHQTEPTNPRVVETENLEPTSKPAQASQTPQKTEAPAKSKPVVSIGKYSEINADNWNGFVQQLTVGGVIGNSLSHCQFVAREGQALQLLLNQDFATLYDPSHQQRIAQALSEIFEEELSVNIEVGEVSAETPAMTTERERQERQAQALSSMQNDPLVQDVIQVFSATLQEDTVMPVDH